MRESLLQRIRMATRARTSAASPSPEPSGDSGATDGSLSRRTFLTGAAATVAATVVPLPAAKPRIVTKHAALAYPYIRQVAPRGWAYDTRLYLHPAQWKKFVEAGYDMRMCVPIQKIPEMVDVERRQQEIGLPVPDDNSERFAVARASRANAPHLGRFRQEARHAAHKEGSTNSRGQRKLPRRETPTAEVESAQTGVVT